MTSRALPQRFMNADFVAVLEFWEREKGISRDVLVSAVQESLVQAAKKAIGPARDLRCVIDQKSGDIRAFAKLVVSEKVASKHDQISVFDARRIKEGANVGDEIENAGDLGLLVQVEGKGIVRREREAGVNDKAVDGKGSRARREGPDGGRRCLRSVRESCHRHGEHERERHNATRYPLERFHVSPAVGPRTRLHLW